jgi:3-hydroxyisobutyrate dehydrogenase-like beta-hydroxyacid dehydrogenase
MGCRRTAARGELPCRGQRAVRLDRKRDGKEEHVAEKGVKIHQRPVAAVAQSSIVLVALSKQKLRWGCQFDQHHSEVSTNATR